MPVYDSPVYRRHGTRHLPANHVYGGWPAGFPSVAIEIDEPWAGQARPNRRCYASLERSMVALFFFSSLYSVHSMRAVHYLIAQIVVVVGALLRLLRSAQRGDATARANRLLFFRRLGVRRRKSVTQPLFASIVYSIEFSALHLTSSLKENLYAYLLHRFAYTTSTMPLVFAYL